MTERPHEPGQAPIHARLWCPDSLLAPTAHGTVAAAQLHQGNLRLAMEAGVAQVVIVPIFWLKRKEEMADVIAAAQRVERLLAGSGVDCGCDTTAPMSPGQKFKHW